MHAAVHGSRLLSKFTQTLIAKNLKLTTLTGIPSLAPSVSDTALSMFVGYTQMSFDEAVQFCFRCGEGLLSVHSNQTQDLAMQNCSAIDHSNLESGGCWIGLQRGDSNDWLWNDNSTIDFGFDEKGLPTSEYPWSRGEPSNYNGAQNCVHLWHRDNVKDPDFYWDDIECSSLNYPICEGIPYVCG